MVSGYVKAVSFWIGFLPSKLFALQDLCVREFLFIHQCDKTLWNCQQYFDVKGGFIARLILLNVLSLGCLVMGVFVHDPFSQQEGQSIQ